MVKLAEIKEYAQIPFYEFMKTKLGTKHSFIFSHDKTVRWGWGLYVGLSVTNGFGYIECVDKDLLFALGKAVNADVSKITHNGHSFVVEMAVEQPFVWLGALSDYLYKDLLITSPLIGYVGSPSYSYIVDVEQKPEKAPTYVCPDFYFHIPLLEIIYGEDHKLVVENRSRVSKQEILNDISSFEYEAKNLIPDCLRDLRNVKWDDISKNISIIPSDQVYEEQVQKVVDCLTREGAEKVVISRLASGRFTGKPSKLFEVLRACSPTRYEFLFETPNYQIVGCSPEILVQQTGKTVTVRAVAGTQVRSVDERDDQLREEDFLSDPKQIIEHLITFIGYVKMMKNRICIPSSVRVREILNVDKLTHILHLTSEIQGQTENEVYQTWTSLLPTMNGTPAVTGYKIALRIEEFNRGIYGGVFGFFDHEQSLFCKIIRTIYLERNNFYVCAGAGITSDSKPADELTESKNKMRSCLYALQFVNHSQTHVEAWS
ncbi:chorismate-binding protein [Alicyclobacillus sendaiensis]|uniref:chorismate-binding protein n=1 Tax=Alicyclobacillus sendaiensis TaxID=192387 RepID=UPI0026F473BC|nr:chorismate-binding protein [Alicyclobacillus sendaiensis]